MMTKSNRVAPHSECIANFDKLLQHGAHVLTANATRCMAHYGKARYWLLKSQRTVSCSSQDVHRIMRWRQFGIILRQAVSDMSKWPKIKQELSSSSDGRSFGHNRLGPKSQGAYPFLGATVSLICVSKNLQSQQNACLWFNNPCIR